MSQHLANVHLIVVTGQAQANLIPILQLKPQVVALAVSKDMKKQADEFSNLLKNADANYKPEAILRFDDVPASNLPLIEQKAEKIYAQLQSNYPNEKIVYHATGGTKLMMLGFCNVFAKSDNQVIYTDTADGFIEVVYPSEQADIVIEHVLTMETYLSSLGEKYQPNAHFEWEQTAQQRKELTFWIAKNAEKLETFFSIVNRFVTKAQKEDFDKGYPQSEHFFTTPPKGIWEDALRKLTSHHICIWDENQPKKLTFTDSTQVLHWRFMD